MLCKSKNRTGTHKSTELDVSVPTYARSFNKCIPRREWTMKFKSDDRMGARKASVTNLKYYESVIFNHARVRGLRWQR
jgi:hypothetical protein